MKDSLKASFIVIFFIAGVVVGGAAVVRGGFISQENDISGEGQVVSMTASGAAEWLFEDDHHLNEEKFGTNEDPKSLDIVPLTNRRIGEDGKVYLDSNSAISFNRAMGSGSIEVRVKDLVALDDQSGKHDEVMIDAKFLAPDGSEFEVKVDKPFPPTTDWEAFGGVVINQVAHGESPVGTPFIVPEFTYIMIHGIGDVYKDGELIDTDRFVFFMVSEKYRPDDFKSGKKIPSNTDNLIVHLVLPSYKFVDGEMVGIPIPTGLQVDDGTGELKEQIHMHVNFLENIKIVGNPLIQ